MEYFRRDCLGRGGGRKEKCNLKGRILQNLDPDDIKIMTIHMEELISILIGWIRIGTYLYALDVDPDLDQQY
jgi:hypothetical protein